MKSTPNENGVFTRDDAERIDFKDKKATASIWLLQLEPGRWLSASEVSHRQGSMCGFCSPLKEDFGVYKSRGEALKDAITEIMRHEMQTATATDSCSTEGQRSNAQKILQWARDLARVNSLTLDEPRAPKRKPIPQPEPTFEPPQPKPQAVQAVQTQFAF